MKITNISQKGIDLIKSFEGFEAEAYLDSVNIPTIGYGTIRYPGGVKVKLGDICTKEKAEGYLKHDVNTFELAVDAMCRDDINQHQFDALVSFCYNLGATNFKSSTLLKKVNANPNDTSIRAEFIKWNRAGGDIVPGLTRRRALEADLYFAV